MHLLTPWEEFKKKARVGSRVPIVAEMPLDLDTPVAVYKRFESEKYRFLLESVEHGEKWGRYSFIGLSPSVILKSFGRDVEIIDSGKKRSLSTNNPLGELKKLLYAYRFVSSPGLPIFPGGAVGFVSYDMVRFFERLPDRHKAGNKVPDLYFMIPQILLVVDSLEQSLKIVYDARIDRSSAIRSEYQKGTRLISKVARQVLKGLTDREDQHKSVKKVFWKSSLSRDQFLKGVERIRDYVAAGDITQTVFSVRFESDLKVDDLELYRVLRRVNPSPYMFHLKFPDMSLVGASPETMVRLEDREMTVRPIAGTRRRGYDEVEDMAMEKELLADEKERAEHIMLVDLGRNDLGRVAEPGSVKVDELMRIERYSHVMHIVSNVRAQLAKGKDAFDLLRATFPAGTLSGSPKIRAMEIIEELEPVRRNFYGGCVGYFGFSGNLDMAITIRSALIQPGKISLQAGAGVVADSKPELEYKECLNKAKGMMKAVEMLCC